MCTQLVKFHAAPPGHTQAPSVFRSFAPTHEHFQSFHGASAKQPPAPSMLFVASSAIVARFEPCDSQMRCASVQFFACVKHGPSLKPVAQVKLMIVICSERNDVGVSHATHL